MYVSSVENTYGRPRSLILPVKTAQAEYKHPYLPLVLVHSRGYAGYAGTTAYLVRTAFTAAPRYVVP